MSKVIKNSDGDFFIEGSGFTGTEKSATRYSDADSAYETVSCLKKAGVGSGAVIVNETVAKGGTFAVVYIRKDSLNADGITIKAPKASDQWPFTPSKRRFATRDEAHQHGSRFPFRRANAGDKKDSGTAGHIGFYIVETSDPVNASINWKSGLTNPVK